LKSTRLAFIQQRLDGDTEARVIRAAQVLQLTSRPQRVIVLMKGMPYDEQRRASPAN
jgi:hypothetical protein